MKDRKPYRIIGAYDSETTNIPPENSPTGNYTAFPILHQLGLLKDGVAIETVDADNVESVANVELYRHTHELTARLDEIASTDYGFVPVICCHNLSFDMYPLADWLMRNNVRVLAKSSRKPITFTVRDDDGNPRLVIWDTLIFSAQSLERMGIDCGYNKGVGEWDYDLVRTPETELTVLELDYAKRDVYALLAWLGWWLRRNPDISPDKLALNVVSKTGVVRERRRVRFDQLKGRGLKYNVGRYWHYINRMEAPKSDDELYSMFAATRGGLTFCASESASVPFDCRQTNCRVFGFDATSQHPAQMVSHRYPVHFHETDGDTLTLAYETVASKPLESVLRNWVKPFGVAFNGLFEFCGLRLKKGSIFERCGIPTLASARFANAPAGNGIELFPNDAMHNVMNENGYCDTAEQPTYAYGKLVAAKVARVWITELAAWEIAQAYDYDSVRGITGYLTMRFVRPPDMSIISVMQFYKAKNKFKRARNEYYKSGTISIAKELQTLKIPDAIVSEMQNGTASDTDIDLQYLSLKSDLNALFGIEASNEYRPDTVLSDTGICFDGVSSLDCKPKNPKVWYQYGQRIVGWSRVAQVCVLLLIDDGKIQIINGDTDSIKAYAPMADKGRILDQLALLASAIDRAKQDNCRRIENAYPDYYDELKGIGHYVLEFESECFCASWNKAYCTFDIDPRTEKRAFAFTIAGIPARDKGSRRGLNSFGNALIEQGWTFAQVCDLLLGYNVTAPASLTGLNARSFPEWGDAHIYYVHDYLGKVSMVAEPDALALHEMGKTLNDTGNRENYRNMQIALRNRPTVNTNRVMLSWLDDGRPDVWRIGDEYAKVL